MKAFIKPQGNANCIKSWDMRKALTPTCITMNANLLLRFFLEMIRLAGIRQAVRLKSSQQGMKFALLICS
jgi:hypothetical protein